MTADRWGGRGSRMGLVTLIRAVLGIDRPARDRTARCWLHWCRRGSSRLHPVIPGSAARSRVEVSPSAHDRGGAPKGERAASYVPRQCGAGAKIARAAYAGRLSLLQRGGLQWCACRRSASLLFKGGTKGFLTVAWQSSDAKAHRENEQALPHPEVPAPSAAIEGCRSSAGAVSFEARSARTSG